MNAHPTILEISAWPWLEGLTAKHSRRITLANIPPSELEGEFRGFDMVWLMGVWERSPRGRDVALNHPALRNEYHRALHDFRDEDVVGSPYSVRRYRVDSRLGGPQGLAVLRTQLKERGQRLLLDFVPNHVAVDHDWTRTKPPILIQGTKEDYQARPEEYSLFEDGSIAHGRDPYFPPWTDTAQINAFSTEARRALLATLMDIASQCDGVRCDMAMLVTTEVFSRTWGERAGPAPDVDFWQELIPPIREHFPDFLFIAEVYWDMEWQLQQQGFDYCYDKRLYDRMAHEDAEGVRAHLTADLGYQEKLLRFIENHDEDRASVVFKERARAASVLALTLPGAKLVHEGQMRGHRIHLPVQLGRRQVEQDDVETRELYQRLLDVVSSRELRYGKWRLYELDTQLPESQRSQLITYVWTLDGVTILVVVNFGPEAIRGHARIRGALFPRGRYRSRDRLHDTPLTRAPEELENRVISLDLAPWDAHICSIQKT
jgi:glycosidase